MGTNQLKSKKICYIVIGKDIWRILNMGGIFSYDSPLMSGLGKLADLVILNLLTLLFCIPIVTIGASLTACHYVALKIRRGEGYVLRNFWKSFKENLRQSTVIWLVMAINVLMSLYATLFVRVEGTMGAVSQGVLFVALIFWAFLGCWIFPLQSKFANTIGTTFKNSFLLSFKYLFRTILMVIINLLPVAALLLLSFQWYSILFMFGFSLPAYLCAMLYDKKFEELENMILAREAEEAGELIEVAEVVEEEA